MNPTTPQHEEIFCQAVEILDPAGREQYLRTVCNGDEQTRRSVDAMLEDHDKATRLFQEISAEISPSEVAAAAEIAPDPELGSAIGLYKLLQRLGEGGGGIVYEALQESPVHRKVALKILKPGMDKQRVVSRFEAERQALELMEHPNIARVLDAGVTRDGRPYFVMELVQGEKITEHCAKHNVSLAGRLQLLQQVCHAVQHAHQKGIIHCDIKPSNILVTEIEGIPVPKVIDFGIAKATASVASEWTRQGFPIGTPAYMSPEQLSGSKDIDTRSDIYSLGVVMYELLAGKPPIDKDSPSTTGVGGDLRQRLMLEEPPVPSAAARLNGATLQWNEDLDWIVLKAIDKDREQRYATMRGFGQDIARYLANEPIHARPHSQFYRFKKLVRRNRLASTAIAASVLALAAGFTTSSLLYFKAQAAERVQAQLRVKAEAAERVQIQLRAEAEEREHVARAAILLLQNKSAEADAEIQQMGGMLTQPSVEATDVFRKLATWNALRGNWKAASQRLLALSRVNNFDETDLTDNASRDLVAVAPTLVEAGEIASYREFEEFLLERMGRTNNPTAAEQVLKICLLLPPSPSVSKRLEPLAVIAERSLPNVSTTPLYRIQAWRCFALGLWKYRIGRYEEANRMLTAAINAPGIRNEITIQYSSLVVRSMVLRELGQDENAAADFAKAKAAVDQKFSAPLEYDAQGYWHDWLNARILLREAEQK